MQDDKQGTGSTLFEFAALVLKMACLHGKAKVRVLIEDEQSGAVQRVCEAGLVDD
jgi:hypothetical protein